MARLNIKMVIIAFDRGGRVSVPDSSPEEELPPVYFDMDRKLYRYFGMQKARFRDLWRLRTLWAYLRLLAGGWKLQKSTGDIYQRGGDVLIDPDGTVRFHHIAAGPADRSDPEALFRLVEESL